MDRIPARFDEADAPCGRLRRVRLGPSAAGILAALLCVAAPRPVPAQAAAELEVERSAGSTATRIELKHDGFFFLRAERRRGADTPRDRVGTQVPGSVLGLDGYVSLFVDDRPGTTGIGTNFELGPGPWVLGGSLERAVSDFTGAYLRLRGGDVEISGGAGTRDGHIVSHGGLYLKNTRLSLGAGGSLGPDDAAYGHLAGTWHPAPDQVGRAPGAWFTFERDGSRDYEVEIAFAHRATFGYLTSWGAYGMDQWPHEKRIEAVGDLMRYFHPSIRNHERSAGAGVLAASWAVEAGERTLTLDGRLFPFRILQGMGTGATSGDRNLRRELLRGLMVGWMERVGDGAGTLLAELRLEPVVIYAELPARSRSEPYVFVQYVLQVRD